NALGYALDDYTSTVRGKTISYASDVIDEVFGFRRADYCWACQQRASAHTDEEYAEMLQTLGLPGKDWRYTASGSRSRLQITDMTSAAKGWAKWLVRNFESCSN
ncbi:hypothetical protein A2U01_0069852, partial [Trifolium medium]|nr:hypothetical protein [Trifolium medium]